MSQTKKPYETTFIVNASLEDPQIEAVVNHVQEIITRNGGEVLAVNRWGRKRLAYTIKKKNNGFYTNIEFSAGGNVIQQLERSYLLDENILRFLTIHREQRPPEIPKPAAEPAPATAAREPIFTDDATEQAK